MQQSVPHEPPGALILNINVSMLRADNNPFKGTYGKSQSLSAVNMPSFLQTQPQPEESGAPKSLMTPTFAYQKLFSHHPPFSLFCTCELVLVGCQTAKSLLVLVVAHSLIRVQHPPPPYTQPHPIMPMKENKAGISL